MVLVTVRALVLVVSGWYGAWWAFARCKVVKEMKVLLPDKGKMSLSDSSPSIL
jgi:hypothetical protein